MRTDRRLPAFGRGEGEQELLKRATVLGTGVVKLEAHAIFAADANDARAEAPGTLPSPDFQLYDDARINAKCLRGSDEQAPETDIQRGRCRGARSDSYAR
jgi:hypothetical protein